MASSYPAQVTAVQVGSYFVGQYYQILQQRPDFAHQFYSDSSAMIRVDGDNTETVSGMMAFLVILLHDAHEFGFQL
ncbi:hypothetical protein J5N97_024342 [Dioscorea zingiberensis]|uniref:NTF2 domain-containing protein n=1 Tax=Dioscorea zingiberensis TaxID=325984 RepID=A0A9D5H8V3_9LILI|nr:hypothetical protein J5N97_024342 [Dioscorea zingiberensis]